MIRKDRTLSVMGSEVEKEVKVRMKWLRNAGVYVYSEKVNQICNLFVMEEDGARV